MVEPSSLIIIPARGGSKGIPHKNMIQCAGKPLLQWTIETALAVGHSLVIVSSDDSVILDFVVEVGASAIRRPDELATDDSPTEDTIEHTVEAVYGSGMLYQDKLESIDAFVLLQPTSPIRTASQVREMIELVRSGGFDSVVSVTPSHHFLWDTETHKPYHDLDNRPMRQQFPEQAVENGSICTFTPDHWRWTMNRLGGKMKTYLMGEDYGLQVDSEFDLWMAEKVLERKVAIDPEFHTK